MKKIVTFVLAAAMAVSLAACGQAPQSSLEGYQTSVGVDMNPQSGISIDDDSKAEESKAASSKTDDEPSLSANTVIFKDTQWNSGRMYVYYWSQENDKMVAWPGSEMTEVRGEDNTYSYDLPNGVEYIIFTDDHYQTRDIKWDGKEQKFKNTSQTDVDKSYYVETMDGRSVDTKEIGGSSEKVVDVDKLRDIESNDSFGVRVTKKELEKDYFETAGKYGKDALAFEIENTTGKTVTDVEILVVAYNADNIIMPIKTEEFKTYDIGSLIYSFGNAEKISVDNGEKKKLAVAVTAGEITGIRCIVRSYVSDGKTVENPTANEWERRIFKGDVTDFD